MRARALVLAISLSLSLAVPIAAVAQESAEPPPDAPPPPPAAPAGYVPPSTAPRDAPAPFGSQGQVVLGVDVPLGNNGVQFGIVHQSQSMGGPSTTLYRIAPSADFFVIPNLSIGALLLFEKQSQDIGGTSLDVTLFGITARLGYNLQLSDLVSIWPRIAIGYTHGSTDAGGTSVTLTGVPLVVDIPILFHPAPHFFVGPGFVYATQLSNSASAAGTSQDQPKITDIGADLTIGGYFGGP